MENLSPCPNCGANHQLKKDWGFVVLPKRGDKERVFITDGVSYVPVRVDLTPTELVRLVRSGFTKRGPVSADDVLDIKESVSRPDFVQKFVGNGLEK